MMRLAVYYPWVYLTSGAERTLLELARRSRHQVTIFTSRYEPDATYPGLREVDIRVVDDVPVQRTLTGVGTAFIKILSKRLELEGYDALLVVCEGLGDLVTLRSRGIPAYCLCLTPLRIVFDAKYRARYLSRSGTLRGGIIRAGSLVFRAIDRLAWRRYRRVFAISQEIRGRILDGRLAEDTRIDVLHPGVELSSFDPTPASEKTFFVPGRIMWTKNLELAIAAFQRFRSGRSDADEWKLQIAGIVDDKSTPYLEQLQQMAGGDPAIQFLLHPSDETMRSRYRACFATLFTAFNEDWGLVIIEAMASGKPVVGTNSGGPREIIRHDRDGLLAEPDAESFAAAMTSLADDSERYGRLTRNAPENAARFGWPAFVRALDSAIEEDWRDLIEWSPVAGTVGASR